MNNPLRAKATPPPIHGGCCIPLHPTLPHIVLHTGKVKTVLATPREI